jgi:hypothetical protein
MSFSPQYRCHRATSTLAMAKLLNLRLKFFERIRGRLKYGRQAVRLMEAFLRNHRELRDPRKG